MLIITSYISGKGSGIHIAYYSLVMLPTLLAGGVTALYVLLHK